MPGSTNSNVYLDRSSLFEHIECVIMSCYKTDTIIIVIARDYHGITDLARIIIT